MVFYSGLHHKEKVFFQEVFGTEFFFLFLGNQKGGILPFLPLIAPAAAGLLSNIF